MLVAILVTCLVVALGIVLLTRQPQRADLGRAAQQSRPDRSEAASELVFRLEGVLTARGAAGAGELTDLVDPARPAAAAELEQLVRNIRALRVTSLDLNYLDETASRLPPQERATYGDDAWVSEVQLSWRFAGIDRAVSTVDVPLVVGWAGTRAVFESARTTVGDYRVPLWFAEPVAVRRTPTTLVLAGQRGDADDLNRLARSAVVTVRRVLPGWRGPLVVEAPASVEDFRAAAGMSRAGALSIAAVTTTADGSTTGDGPVHVFLNPDVFDPLGPQGRQIVVSHEATHVALDAANTTLPLWLSEGTADYVALLDNPLPDRVLAAQIRSLVRHQGAPSGLPGPAEFESSNKDIGAWYEAAWLAVKLIGETYGTRTLLRFYRASEADGGHLRRTFRTVLHTTGAAFTRAWRAELVELAK